MSVCTPVAAMLLGAGAAEQVVGAPLGEWFDDAARAWLQVAFGASPATLDERLARTRGGRWLRLTPVVGDPSRLHLHDATRWAALRAERERALTEGAILDLVPMLRRELNDPMSIVLGRLELVLELTGGADPGVERQVSVALAHARRVSTTLHLLRMVGRSPPACCPAVELSRAVHAALAEVGASLRVHRLQVAPVSVAADAEVLGHGLVALFERLADRSGPGGRCTILAEEVGARVTLTAALDHATERPEVEWGSPSDAAHDLGVVGAAFARFGIGIEVIRDGGGMGYRLDLPRATPISPGSAPSRPDVWVVGIPDPGEQLARALGRAGCRVHVFDDAERAIRQLATAPPDALMTALCLPGRSGLALLDVVGLQHPSLLPRCALVARASVPGVPPTVRQHALPLDPEAVLRAWGLAPTP